MFVFILIGALLGSSVALLLTPHRLTHHEHKDQQHLDQTSVDSRQAREVYQQLTKGNNTLDLQNLKNFLNASDTNNDGEVTSDEFLKEWYDHDIGSVVSAVPFFVNLDANKDGGLTERDDLKIIFGHFDRNDDGKIDEAEFVVQWVKMSSV